MTTREQIDLARRAVRGETAYQEQGYQSPQIIQQLVSPPAVNTMVHAVISISGAGTTEIVPAIVGQQIRIYELMLYTETAQDLTLLDGAVPVAGQLKNWPAQTGLFLGYTGEPHFELTAGNAFKLITSAAGQISGFVRFRMG